MKTFKTTNGFEVIIDDDWYDDITSVRWSAAAANQKYIKTIYKNHDGVWVNVYLHRLIIGANRGETVDHINGNTYDNRRENLRICSKSQNGFNRGPNKNNLAGFKGVQLRSDKKKWMARINVMGKAFYLGCFDTKELASEAYKEASKRLHGEFGKA